MGDSKRYGKGLVVVMKKIPALFVLEGDPGSRSDKLYTDVVTPGYEWVFQDEGVVATWKRDGTAVLIRDGEPWARYDLKRDKKTGIWPTPPEGAIACQEPDELSGHWPHWVRADRPQDVWIREAVTTFTSAGGELWEGTYEACGPKIGANKEKLDNHILFRHGDEKFHPQGWTWKEGLKDFLSRVNIEGIVFYHPDGRMAKVTRKGFGFPWPA